MKAPVSDGGIQRGQRGVLQEELLRVVEAAHAGGTVAGGGNDGHERVVGAVRIAGDIGGGAGGPLAEEALRVGGHSAHFSGGQGVISALQGGGQFLRRDGPGHHIHAQGDQATVRSGQGQSR